MLQSPVNSSRQRTVGNGERTQQLLAETEGTLIEIGLQVGCADQSHFTALFDKHAGMTPKTYRDHTRK